MFDPGRTEISPCSFSLLSWAPFAPEFIWSVATGLLVVSLPAAKMLSYGTMAETFKEQFARGYKARREDRLADSRAIFIKAVRSAAEEGVRPALAEALCGLGQAERGIGNLEAARHHYASAAVLYRQIGPPERLAYAIRHEADILREAGLPAEAEPLYLEAEAIYREQGEGAELDLANTLRGLGLANESLGRSDASRSLFEQARALYAKCNVEAGVAECDEKLAP
jgi:tetratricopeptide (TPR) repeat protein